jgi:hypothetical protein
MLDGASPRLLISGYSWKQATRTLSEDKGVVKLSCGNCGYVALFDGETLGIRGLWDRKRGV